MSDLPIPPGSVLEEELDAREMTQRELAQRTGRPYQAINEIIQGKKVLTHRTALDLEKVLGIPAHVWVNLESRYQMTLAQQQERKFLEEQAEWLTQFPMREIEKLRWVSYARDKAEKARLLLKFLEMASFQAWSDHRQTVFGFRISGNASISPGALTAWLRQGEIEGEAVETADYDESAFRDAIGKARDLTLSEAAEFEQRLPALCAQAGVAVVFVQELPKMGANAVARWLAPNKGLIQLSLRWKRHDIFWFNFFHECRHILVHKVREIFIDGVDGEPDAEAEADRFAADTLIPREDWGSFRESGNVGRFAILDFAQEVGVDPGIVVGRLQKEGAVPWNRMNDLRRSLRWV
jgi:addiction module HigA family antidote